MGQIISPDQTGFIRDRYSFSNIRRLFNIVYSSHSNNPEVVLSLDVEKAFDRVEWNYLFQILGKFGFGPIFTSWIKLLYAAPKASVRTNNVFSEYFNLQRGTRQGCPLSPLLFAIAIEPLAIALRSSAQVCGIIRAGTVHKVSLYADDLLFFLSNPLSSIPQTLSILDIYSSFSGYKLHFCKSELFPLNSPSLQISYSDFQFKVIRNRFKYLGIQVTRKYSDLFSANISPLHNHIKSLFMSWKCLPLSLIGRVNVIKMNVLPKFLYLFQCLPIFIPKSFFTILQRNISSFIWNKSKRINQSHLMKPKCLGGLALPNLQTYYWAANIRSLLYWVQQDLQLKEYQWVRMEAASCIPATLTSLLSVPVYFKYTTLIKKNSC